MTSSLFDQETALAAPTSLAPVRFSMIGAAHPITGGVAPFNEAIVRAMRARGPADFISWNRLYPPLLRRGEQTAPEPARPGHEPAPRLLDWHDPRTWRRAMTRVLDFGAQALVLPWLHPVMTPPFRWMLRHAPRDVSRVVICHNVELHERLPGAAMLTRAVLRHADLLVTHAPQQRAELARLRLDEIPLVEAFLPIFEPDDFGDPTPTQTIQAERMRLGEPDLVLLTYGAVRPYKGVDLAVEAMQFVDPSLDVRLVIAGKFWIDPAPIRERIAELGLGSRVVLHDGYQSDEATARHFDTADAVLLPYRSAPGCWTILSPAI